MSRTNTRLPGVYAIGLTGGIASGKSTVSSMLADLGAKVIDADEISHRLTAEGSKGLRRIIDVFGSKALNPDGTLNRKELGRIIFRDDEARSRLEAIIHPLVMASIREELLDLSQAWTHLRREGEPEGEPANLPLDGQIAEPYIAVLDIPLLFEVGAENLTDEVWVVAVDRETQIVRLMERDGHSRAEACSRIDAQMPLSEKVKRATAVIDNGGDRTQTRKRVEELWLAAKRKTFGSTRN